VNGLTIAIALQHEDARPLGIRRIVFDHDGLRQAGEHIADANVICGELVVPVEGYANGALLDESSDQV
jgi:hypothetical protein